MMRLAVVSTSDNTNEIVDVLKGLGDGAFEIALHIGKAQNDFKGSSLSRLNAKKGRKGHPFSEQRWSGAAVSLFEHPDFLEKLEEFVDHLHRRSEINAYNSHPLRTMQDYSDYFHILADVIGQELLERRISHCLFFNVPHLTYDTILYLTARSLGLPCLILTQSLFPNRFFSMADASAYGRMEHLQDATSYPIDSTVRPDLFYMQGIKQEREKVGSLSFKAFAQFITFLLFHRPVRALNPIYAFKTLRKMAHVYGAFPKWRDPFAEFFHEDDLAYFDHLVRFEDVSPDLTGDYVYFPLQLQPEMTTSALGGRYRDQAYAIENLAGILPDGVRILVKENPRQSGYMRGPMFFHRLKRIPSVTFLSSWANTHELTANARFVATITGTVGWEAIRQGKPALVFGYAWYRGLPGVHEFRDDLTYDEIIGRPIDHRTLEARTGRLVAGSHEGLIDRHYTKQVNGFNSDENKTRIAQTILDLLHEKVELTFR